MQTSDTLDKIIEQTIKEELDKLQRGTRVRTLDFVNNVVTRLREKLGEFNEDVEVDIRGKIVDILWELQRKNIIKFDETLIRFEKL